MIGINVIWVAVLAFVVNVPLGRWRSRYGKFTLPWWLLIHASVPLIIVLRIWQKVPHIMIPVFILLAIAGQIVGRKSAAWGSSDK